MKRRWITLVLAAAFLTGCLGGISASPTATMGLYVADTGELMSQSMQDDGLEFDQVWVTINSIEAKRNGQWEVIAKLSGSGAKVDLLDLQAQAHLLLEKAIPAGHYSEFRLVLSEKAGDSYVVFRDGTKEALKVPSGKLQIRNIDLVAQADTVVELIIDIDTSQFIVRGDNGLIVNPARAIRMLEGGYLGSLDFRLELPGFILDELAGLINDLTVGFSVKRSGSERPFAELAFENGILKFSLDRLLPGTYEVSAFVSYREQFRWDLQPEKIIVKPGPNTFIKKIPG